MKHLSDDLIERYILGDLKSGDNLALIEKHFAECYSCNQLKEEMADYYAMLDETGQHQLESKNAVVRIEPVFNAIEAASKPSIKNLPARFMRKVESNPAKSTALIAAALILATLINTKNILNSGGSLEYFTVNEAERLINLYDQKDNLLWRLPYNSSVNPIESESEFGVKTIQLTDLNDDGEKELITTLDIDGKKDRLLVYDKNKNHVFAKKLGKMVYCKMSGYEDDFVSTGFIFDENEIFVGAKNRRSPFKLARYGADGKLIGEYWHYGHVWGMYISDVAGGSEKEIILCGINDDSTQAALIILDPQKLIGEKESAVTRGFSLAKSDAEIAYVLFPLTSVDVVNRERTNTASPRAKRMINQNLSAGTFTILISGDEKNTAPEFDVTLNRELKIVSVKPIDHTYRIFNEYHKKGFIAQPLTAQTLEDYKAEIKYWDGEKFLSSDPK